jgi:hypothetical protein
MNPHAGTGWVVGMPWPSSDDPKFGTHLSTDYESDDTRLYSGNRTTDFFGAGYSFSESEKGHLIRLQQDIFEISLPADELKNSRIISDDGLTVLLSSGKHLSLGLHRQKDLNIDKALFPELPRLFVAEDVPEDLSPQISNDIADMQKALRNPLGPEVETGNWARGNTKVYYLLGKERAILFISNADEPSNVFAQLSLHGFSPPDIKTRFPRAIRVLTSGTP